MAESFLSDISVNIIKTLGDRAIKELGVWWNYKDELEKLEDTMATIQAVLQDAEEEREPSYQFKLWLRKLRNVLYDAEELVDDFSTEVKRREIMNGNNMAKEVRLFFSRTSNQFFYGHRMGHKIKAVRDALDAIANDRQKFHFTVRSSKTLLISSEERDNVEMFKHHEDVSSRIDGEVLDMVRSDGHRDNDKRNIIKLLRSDGHMVVAIVGSGGLGKTTLARLIFDDDDDELKGHFDLRMWVSVGDNGFTVDEIAQKAIKHATGTETDEGDKVKKFREIIGSKRFLLVLDDVWSDDCNKWLDLENLWKQDDPRGSKVVLTTRNLDVAKMIGNLNPYQLGYLSFEDSYSLFKEIVFRGKGPPTEEVEENVKKIVEKCGGVPLAIKTTANLLFFLDPETEWLAYVTNELSKYPEANNNIFPTLKLSYHHLPSPLKYCFAYCKIFPKGHVIDVETLIQLWIAQGYIRKSNKSNQSLEDIGMRYCKVLLARSFFEDEVFDEFGNLASLKMHDIMHELASDIAGEDIVFSRPQGEDVNKCSHHLSYKIGLSRSLGPGELDSLLEAKKLRTFMLMRNKDTALEKLRPGQHGNEARECHKMLKKFKSLLVLDLQQSDLEIKIPEFFHSPIEATVKWAKQDWVLKPLGKLKHLRHLDLSSTNIKKLPKSITKLQNLQVLKIIRCTKLKKLPKDIGKLVSLQILDCWDCLSLRYMPRGLEYLTSLHTLTMFVVPEGPNPSKHQAGLDELKGLPLLRELRIVKLEGVKNDLNLKKKTHLRQLSLSWKDSNVGVDSIESALGNLKPPDNLQEWTIKDYQGVKFPNWFPDLTNLVKIAFVSCSKCEHLPPLSRLPRLKRIKIEFCAALRYVEDDRSVGNIFPILKRLRLYQCPKLERWWKSEDNADGDSTTPQFPYLSNLLISGCPLLTSIPLFPTLDESLYLSGTSIKPLQQTLKTVVPVSTTTPSSLVLPLSGLKKLVFWGIEDPTSIPEQWMHQLSSLRSLELHRCGALSDRCGNKNGADWHKISHIPNIEVDWRTIQKEGRYQLDEQES